MKLRMACFGILCCTVFCHRNLYAQSSNPGVTSDPRLNPNTPGIPAWGVAFEAGKDTKQLSGRGAVHHGQFSLDFQLTGADVNKTTGRSDILNSLAAAKGGTFGAGITWHSFDLSDSSLPERVQKLCEEQTKGRESKARAAYELTDEYKKLQAETKVETSATLAAATAAESLTDALTALEMATKQFEEAEKYLKEIASHVVTSDALQIEVARKEYETKRLGVLIASGKLSVAATRADVTDRDARAASAERKDVEQTAKKKEEEITKVSGAKCDSDGDLDRDAQARLRWDGGLGVVLSLKGQLGTQSTDYFDAGDGKTKTDTQRPTSMSFGIGMYATPLVFPAVTLGYRRDRSTGPTGQVCFPSAIGGVQTTPATYTCSDTSIGVPAWKRTTSLRVEVRHYLGSGVAWDPSVLVVWSGPESGLFEQKQGMWQLEAPVYYQVTSSNGGLALGLSYLHRQTWGLGSANVNDDGLVLFLAAGFDIGKV